MIQLAGARYLAEPGRPQLPYFTTWIGIPEDSLVEVKVITSAVQKEKDFLVYPVPKKVKERTKTGLLYWKELFFQDKNFYQKNLSYPSSLVKTSKAFYFRDQKIISLNIYPFSYNPGKREIFFYQQGKIQVLFRKNPSFSKEDFSPPRKDPFFEPIYRNLILNYEQAKRWRRRRRFFSREEISPFTSLNPFYKFKVTQSGLYKITYQDLKEAGARMEEIEMNRIKMYNAVPLIKDRGGCPRMVPEITDFKFYNLPEEPINASPPRPEDFLTPAPAAEVKIYLADQDKDNRFDEEDYLLFYGLGANWFDYLEKKYYVHSYSLENIYWLTWQGPPTTMAETVESPPYPQAEEISDFFQTKRHFQEKFLPLSFELYVSPFNNYWLQINSGREIEVPFTLPAVEKNQPAFFSWFPFYPPSVSTSLQLELNGNSFSMRIGISGTCQRKEENIASFLKPGKNILKIHNPHSNEGAVFVRFFTLEFSQKYEALENVLYFTNPESKRNGTYNFRLNGFTTGELEIFEITNPAEIKRITAFAFEGGVVRFGAEFNGEKKVYLAVARDKILSPEFVGKRESSSIVERQAVDYLIITHPSFEKDLERLKRWRESRPLIFQSFKSPSVGKKIREGCPRVKIVNILQIYDHFSYGLPDPVAIRNFLHYTLHFWDEVHKPAYVLLTGSCGFDFKGPHKDKNLVPSFHYENKDKDNIFSLYTYRTILTDSWLVNFNSGPTNNIPEMNIGRLCVNNSTDLKITLDRIESFERGEGGERWRRRVLLIADDDEKSSETRPGDREFWPELENLAHNLNYAHQPYFPREYQINKVYLKDYPRAPDDCVPEATQEVLNQLNRGQFLVIFCGHGAQVQMADENVLSVSYGHLDRLFNHPYYPIFLTMACGNGAVDSLFRTLASEYVSKHHKKGAIAFFSSTRLSSSGTNLSFCRAFLTHLFYQRKDDEEGLEPLSQTTLGNAFTLGKIKSRLRYGNDYLLSGDPGLIIGDVISPLIKVKVDGAFFPNLGFLPPTARVLKVEITDQSGIKEAQIDDGGKITSWHKSPQPPYPTAVEKTYRLQIKPDQEYQVKIEAIDGSGNKGSFFLQVNPKLVVKNLVSFPNPLTKKATITYEISQTPDRLWLKIYTLSGRLVQKLESQEAIFPGRNKIVWDGRDKEGILVANGVYLYRIEAEKGKRKVSSEIEKIVVLR
jgi:hypothetical protein